MKVKDLVFVLSDYADLNFVFEDGKQKSYERLRNCKDVSEYIRSVEKRKSDIINDLSDYVVDMISPCDSDVFVIFLKGVIE